MATYIERKKVLHTTLPKHIYDWLSMKAEERHECINDIIISVVTFYQVNAEKAIKYDTARLALKIIVREELKEQGLIK